MAEGVKRRDMMVTAALAFAGVGAVAALWPLIDQMNPGPGTTDETAVRVDLKRIEPGHARRVMWRGVPVLVRHRTTEEIAAARAVPLNLLHDPLARSARHPADAPALDEHRTDPADPAWLVVVGLCTHLGCALDPNGPLAPAQYDEALFCKCHAARYDTAGRVRGGPAMFNLPVPPWRFVDASTIEISDRMLFKS